MAQSPLEASNLKSIVKKCSLSERIDLANKYSYFLREKYNKIWKSIVDFNSDDALTNSLANLLSNGYTEINIGQEKKRRFIDSRYSLVGYNNISVRTVDISDQIDILLAFRIATNRNLVWLVSRYLNAPARLHRISLTWSNKGTNLKEENGQLFHRDRDDLKCLQLFIYGNDVSASDGAHQYIPRTHETSALREKPYNKYLMGDEHAFLTEENIISELSIQKDEIKTLTGKAGTAFIEDTAGFHRGTVVKDENKPRLMLGITWGYSLDCYTDARMGNLLTEFHKIANNMTDEGEKLNQMQKHSIWL